MATLMNNQKIFNMKKKYLVAILALFMLGATLSGCYCVRCHPYHYYHHY